MSLRIGEVSKLLNISIETIRFYESENIIKPSRIQGSKHRQYETWDLFYLMECLKYRSLGIPVKEISKILHNETLDYYLERIKNKKETVQKNIQYEMLLLEKLNNDMDAMEAEEKQKATDYSRSPASW